MPNSLAYLALIAWPLVAVGLFLRLSLERAVIWSILGAYLVLPPVAALDFPLLPPLDKVTIPNVAALVIVVALLGKRVAWLPRGAMGRGLTLLFVFSPLATVLTNADAIPFAIGGLPGLRIHDALSAMIQQALALAPFLLARRFLATEAAQREILLALVIAGLAYSIPMLVEIRLSPQINTWVYGFFQHDFIQMMRQGGFRPIVFLQHGLWVAFLAMMTTLAALALGRAAAPARRAPFMLAAAYLGAVLVLCKSLGALIYAVVLAPVVLFADRRTQIRIAAAFAVIAVLYPLLRGADLVPVGALVAQAERIDPDRAQSLAYRFDNEDVLLARAREKPFFGWGGWGRNHVYDQGSGRMLTVTDGRWIIVIGTLGWFGYLGEFGLLTLPLFMLWRAARRRGTALSAYAGPLALMTGINMFDMLPNATLIPFTWLIAGSILGYAEALAAGRAAAPAIAAGPAGARGADPPAAAPRPRTIL